MLFFFSFLFFPRRGRRVKQTLYWSRDAAVRATRSIIVCRRMNTRIYVCMYVYSTTEAYSFAACKSRTCREPAGALRQLVLYDEARDCSFLSMRQHFLCYNSATSDSFDEGIRSSLYRRHVVIIIANLFGTFTRELIYVAASKRGDFPARHHLSAQRNGE